MVLVGRLVVITLVAACGSGGASVDARERTRLYRISAYKPEVPMPIVLPGVEVCVRERPELPCGVTGANGFATLDIPLTEVSLVLTAPGFERMILAVGTEGSGGLTVLLHEQAVLETLLAKVGLQYPSAALVSVNAVINTRFALEGAMLAISPAATGPIYARIGALDALDPVLTQTDASGYAAFGNVADGEVEVTITHPPQFPCEGNINGGGWVTDQPNRLRAPAVAGHDTVFVFECGGGQ